MGKIFYKKSLGLINITNLIKLLNLLTIDISLANQIFK